MKRALYIGKFQPFHIGHLSIVECIAAASDIDEIVICIGSSQWDWKNPNPERPLLDNFLTWQERKEVINFSLKGVVSKKVHIVPILDFLPKWGKESTPKWFDCIKTRAPEFSVLYTNREREVELFSKAGYEVRPYPLKYNFSATFIREKMALGAVWEPLVSPNVVTFLRKLGVEDRLADLFSRVVIRPKEHEDLCWEWRTFDVFSKEDVKKILDQSYYKNKEIVDEYLFSLVRIAVNLKFRENGFKIKKLLTRDNQGIEAWEAFESDFPIEKSWFIDGCRSIRFPMPLELPEQIEKETLISLLSKERNPYLFLFPLKKKRFMRLFQNCEARCGVDFNIFNIGGQAYTSVGLESKNKEDIKIVLEQFGFKKYRPMNYMQFIEKIVLKEAGNDIWKKL